MVEEDSQAERPNSAAESEPSLDEEVCHDEAPAAALDALRDDFHDLRDQIERGFTDLERGFTEMRLRLNTSAAGQKRLIESFSGDEG